MESSDRAFNFLGLPYDLKIEITKYCDIETVGRLASTCREMHNVINNSTAIWSERSLSMPFTNQVNERFRLRCCRILQPKEKCILSKKWIHGRCLTHYLRRGKEMFMPWIQLDNNALWYSAGKTIYKFDRRPDGSVTPVQKTYRFHAADVVRFCSTPSYIISGGRDRQIFVWRKDNKDRRILYSATTENIKSHTDDVNCVTSSNNLIVSGSREKTVKIWSLPTDSESSLICEDTLGMLDNIWDVCLMPLSSLLIVGSAGVQDSQPLQVYDAEIRRKVANLGPDRPRGAGILQICPETPFELLTTSYDATIQQWDTRSPSRCVNSWDDPNDAGVYSVDSDHYVSFVSGSQQHGIVCLWDKRVSRCRGVFYMGHHNSPVYSLLFDPCSLFAALDRRLLFLKFGDRNRQETWEYRR